MDEMYLSRRDISEQLADIKQRSLPLPGKRQVDFTRVEVLICFGLFFIVNPHSYGGRNIHMVPQEVQRIACFFKRSPNSILSKMLNLDGSRKNSARDEVLLFAQLSANIEEYVSIYKDIVRIARHLGIDELSLPDFLDEFIDDLEDEKLLLGQEELPASSGRLLEKEHALLDEVGENFGLEDALTEKVVEHKVRLTQHRFALDVLKNCARTCVFCGFAPRTLPGKSGLLRASHIKPWSVSTNEERMDVRNGLAACPIHDAAFDQGYLTVDQTNHVHRASILLQSIMTDPGVEAYFGKIVRSILVLPVEAKQPHARYLDYHQREIFRS